MHKTKPIIKLQKENTAPFYIGTSTKLPIKNYYICRSYLINSTRNDHTLTIV